MITININDGQHNVHGYLFQASMWRRYAMDWDGPLTFANSFTRSILGMTRDECMRRAREAVEKARILNKIETGLGATCTWTTLPTPPNDPEGVQLRKDAMAGDRLAAMVYQDWLSERGMQPDFAFAWSLVKDTITDGFRVPAGVMKIETG